LPLLFLRDSATWINELDLSGVLHKAKLRASCAELDVTAFQGGGYRTRLGGLRTADIQAEGFWDSPQDASIFGALGSTPDVVTMSPEGAETKTAYIMQANYNAYEAFGNVGDVVPITFQMSNTDKAGLIRGQMALKKTTISATGAVGSGLNLGAVSATQFLYATLHTFSVGATVTVIIQSDTANNFPAPTTRATIGPITAVGGTFMARVAGPITDTWWRFNVSVITGSFSLAGAIGIGS
jgi:hypothetical protein